jgi:hypothetical protein
LDENIFFAFKRLGAIVQLASARTGSPESFANSLANLVRWADARRIAPALINKYSKNVRVVLTREHH